MELGMHLPRRIATHCVEGRELALGSLAIAVGLGNAEQKTTYLVRDQPIDGKGQVIGRWEKGYCQTTRLQRSEDVAVNRERVPHMFKEEMGVYDIETSLSDTCTEIGWRYGE